MGVNLGGRSCLMIPVMRGGLALIYVRRMLFAFLWVRLGSSIGMQRTMAAFNLFFRSWFVVLFDCQVAVIRPNWGRGAARAAAQPCRDEKL